MRIAVVMVSTVEGTNLLLVTAVGRISTAVATFLLTAKTPVTEAATHRPKLALHRKLYPLRAVVVELVSTPGVIVTREGALNLLVEVPAVLRIGQVVTMLPLTTNAATAVTITAAAAAARTDIFVSSLLATIQEFVALNAHYRIQEVRIAVTKGSGKGESVPFAYITGVESGVNVTGALLMTRLRYPLNLLEVVAEVEAKRLGGMEKVSIV